MSAYPAAPRCAHGVPQRTACHSARRACVCEQVALLLTRKAAMDGNPDETTRKREKTTTRSDDARGEHGGEGVDVMVLVGREAGAAVAAQ